MTNLAASVQGIGFWANSVPSWAEACSIVNDGATGLAPRARPAPQLLAPNERRRAPETVAVALQVALEACHASGRDPESLPCVFASTHGDLTITDYMCATLAQAPAGISPTRFHNSVHNAAAGYWTIGANCMQAATAISAFNATFAQGLIEALTQLACGTEAVLLVAYDGNAGGPLAAQSPSTGLLGGALVLTREAGAGTQRLTIALDDGTPAPVNGALAQHCAGNAMMPMLPLFEALATEQPALLLLDAGPERVLRVEVVHD